MAQTLARLLRTITFGLSLTYVAYSTLHSRIALADDAQAFLPRLIQYGTTAAVKVLLLGLVTVDDFLKMFMTSTNVLTLIGPVTLVACYVQQVLVQIDIVAAHDGTGIINDIGRQSGLASNFDGKRAAGMSYIETEQRLHTLAVVEH